MTNARLIAVLAVVAVVAAGCGDDDAVRVDGAWARPSPAMADAGAVYAEITVAEADELVGVAVDASVAATAEIHETVMADMGGGMEGEEGMGAMTMQQIRSIPFAAGETVALEPGGLHIMLLGLPEPLEDGRTFEVELTFAGAGTVTVSVEVRSEAP